MRTDMDDKVDAAKKSIPMVKMGIYSIRHTDVGGVRAIIRDPWTWDVVHVHTKKIVGQFRTHVIEHGKRSGTWIFRMVRPAVGRDYTTPVPVIKRIIEIHTKGGK